MVDIGSVTTEFQHIAVTYDGSEVRTYLDGTLQSSGIWAGATLSLEIAKIGINRDENLSYDGLIDEVEIFDRALTAEEVHHIYDAGSAGKCKPEVPACTIDLVLSYTGGNLNLDFSMSSNVTTTWKIIGVVGGSPIPLASLDLPVIPAWSPSFSFPLPPIGTIGMLTALITPAEGVLCSDFETVDTGASAVSGQGLDRLRRSFAETTIGP